MVAFSIGKAAWVIDCVALRGFWGAAMLVAITACDSDDDAVIPPSQQAADPESAPSETSSTAQYLVETPEGDSLGLVSNGRAIPLVVSSKDYPGVVRVVDDLRDDLERVSHVSATVSVDTLPPGAREMVIVGTLGISPLVERIVSSGKLNVRGIKGKWESFIVETIERPMPGVDRALVVVGSDQRGTIFGAYDISEQMGVSPWHFWDDVPAAYKPSLYVKKGRHMQGEPAVKYRGFFINDENPATGNWAPKAFGPGLAEIKRAGTGEVTRYTGGLNHRYWERVFEVALRLKANYIWPAVWGRAFADDDPENHATASRYGIVMGTSHEAPMGRAIDEWNRRVDPTTRANAGVDDTVTHQGKDDFSPSGNGEWRYSTNAESLQAYFTEGMTRIVDHDIEAVITLGMRGPGDVKLPPDTGIPLLQRIINDQRSIIGQVTGKDVTTVPQVWTLYKEVQNWWDAGLRVPDDVTVVWCDDNWGNIRELPNLLDPPRSGGYGLYYHFDYVGGGRSYKWVDTNSLPNIWEQLSLAYAYGVDRLWMFNVGDLKNNELPLSFALSFAWNPARITSPQLPHWTENWVAQQFGPEQASSIADILRSYGNLQSDRKPELLNRRITLDPTKDPAVDSSAILYSDALYFAKDTNGKLLPPEQRTYYDDNPFSLTNYGEMERVVAEWQSLSARTKAAGLQLPGAYQDAYYELVAYPVEATANLYQLRLSEFENILYAGQLRASTNDAAAEAQSRFEEDQAMSNYYNTALANGKWSGWQTQPHIGYGDQDRYGGNAPWQQPQLNELALPDSIFPALQLISVPAGAAMGVAIDGSTAAWPAASSASTSESSPRLPDFSPYQTQPAQYIEIFNRGSAAFDYDIQVDAPPGSSNGNGYALPWVFVVPSQGHIDATNKQTRAVITVDWAHAPASQTEIPLAFVVTAHDDANTTVRVEARVEVPVVADMRPRQFIAANGVVSMEASHYNRVVAKGAVTWKRIDDLGRTGDAMTPEPNTAEAQTPGGDSPRLEYDFYALEAGDVNVRVYASPRNSVLHQAGLRYGISIDDGAIQTVNINLGDDLTGGGNRTWEWRTSDNVNVTTTRHAISAVGPHTVKLWMVEPTFIAQKIVVDWGGLRESYFGPPESYRGLDWE